MENKFAMIKKSVLLPLKVSIFFLISVRSLHKEKNLDEEC